MRFLAYFLVLSLTLAVSPAFASEEAGTTEAPPYTTASMLERMDRLEQAVAALARRLDAAEAPAPEAQGATPEARIAALELQLAAISSELTRLKDAGREPTPATASADGSPDGTESVQGVIPSPVPPDMIADVHYLPSRSWAGGKLHYGGSELKIVTHGFVDLEYADAGADGSRDGVAGFDSHHANLFFDANLRSNLLGHVEVEFEHSGDTVEIDQAYLKWALRDWMALDVGRFYTPFGMERFTWYSPTNMLASRPLVYRVIVPGNFYANGIKASGLLRQGSDPRFTYEFSLSNGLGGSALDDRRDSRQTRNNNSKLAYSGRAAWVVTRHIELGASFHSQKYDDAGELGLRFSGLDFSTRWQGFELRSEYVEAALDRLAPSPRLEQTGWYGQLAYTFDWDREILPALSLITRYDRLDLDAATDDDDRRFWSLGVNAKIYDHFRLKSEYMFAREAGAAKDDDLLLFQFVADF